jgi:hypothetical protein
MGRHMPGLRSDRVFLVVGSDFEVLPSQDYSEAYRRDAGVRRLRRRGAHPMAIRKLTVT